MRIKVNILWNLGGTVLPMIAAFLAVPTLIEKLGVERFAILSLAWIIVGYFGFFDFGLGRAMTQLIAQRIGAKEELEVPYIIRNGMIIMTILGCCGGLVIASISPWLVDHKLMIPEELRSETLTSFFILAASIPIVIITTGLRGVLEAHHKFDIVNIIRTPLAIFTYLGPLVVLIYSNQLPPIVSILVLGRSIMGIIYSFIVFKMYPKVLRSIPLNINILKKLFSFGTWMTLSNIAAPLLLYLGRFFLSVTDSLETVTYFSTPYEVVINLLLIPGIFVNTLFPLFSEKIIHDKEFVKKIYNNSLYHIMIIMFPLCLISFFLAKPGISWWINVEFANHTYYIAKILLIGIFINSFGYISQTLVQAYGRPNLTAQLHVIELIAYVPYLWWLVDKYGAEGAAIAWVIRVSISTIVLLTLANKCLNGYIKRTS